MQAVCQRDSILARIELTIRKASLELSIVLKVLSIYMQATSTHVTGTGDTHPSMDKIGNRYISL